ncbi:transposon Ty3-I Gag-Pol polyprotein [Nephila pilipes]|uniref:Transposon Ty3-I Gag-Pol polyprotein n=1 Tax=Nephila pilipes TaxID=299642 RepID=A0A8X6TJ72_NEPPI|nr:transposon Ty3-I Gag-Pol polyprotein [Nephila pilipes]
MRYGQEGRKIPLFSANIEIPKLCSVFAKEKTVIPARSECLIRGVTKASEHFRYVVTNSSSQISKKGVLVAATLVDLKEKTIPVRILNMDNKPKTMDKGAIIASYKPVVDIVAHPQEFSGEHPFHSILENLEGLNDDQRTALQKLLQEIRNFFSTCDADVGHCNVTQHKINTGDHPPIKQNPRRFPLARKKDAERPVKEMVDNGIIEESSGPWASPIVLVKKKRINTVLC